MPSWILSGRAVLLDNSCKKETVAIAKLYLQFRQSCACCKDLLLLSALSHRPYCTQMCVLVHVFTSRSCQTGSDLTLAALWQHHKHL